MYISTAIIRSGTANIFPPPIQDMNFIVPALRDGTACGFDNIRVRSCDGTIDGVEDVNPCLFTAVPIMYVSSTQSPVTGDMEVVKVSDNIYRTRSFPDGLETAVVLLVGTLKEKITLPADCRPDRDLVFVSGPNQVVKVDRSGLVSSSSPGFPSLDNIRFYTSLQQTKEDVSVIRPRFPNRSLLYRIHPQASGTKFAARESDLMLPVTLQVNDVYELGVSVLTREGHLVIMDRLDRPFDVVSDILISSIHTGPVPPPGSVKSALSILWQDEDKWSALLVQVKEKLGALSFSRLSGEKESRCLRKSREWRQQPIYNS
jgi:hypothetical protein